MPTDIYTLSGDIHTVEESYEEVTALLGKPGTGYGSRAVEFKTETEVTVYGDAYPASEDWYAKEDSSYTIFGVNDLDEVVEKRTTYKYKTVVCIVVSSITAWEPEIK